MKINLVELAKTTLHNKLNKKTVPLLAIPVASAAVLAGMNSKEEDNIEEEVLISDNQPVFNKHEFNLLNTPIEELRNNYINLLNEIYNDGKISENLYKNLKEALDKDNFNLRAVYNNYFELLNLCETEEDIKSNYPEITFPPNPASQVGNYKNSTRVIRTTGTYKTVYKPKAQEWRRFHSPEELADIKNKILSVNNPSTGTPQYSIKDTESIVGLLNSLETKIPLMDIVDKILSKRNENSSNITAESFLQIIKTLKCYNNDKKFNNIIEFYRYINNSKQNYTFKVTTSNAMQGGINPINKFVAENTLLPQEACDIIQNTSNIKVLTDAPKELIYLYHKTGNNGELISDITQCFLPEEIKKIANALQESDFNIEDSSKYTSSSDKHEIAINILSYLGLENNEECINILEAIYDNQIKLNPLTYEYRLQNINYVDILKDVIKKLYVDFQPIRNIKTKTENGDEVLAHNLSRYNKGEWSIPDVGIYKLITQSEQTAKELSDLSNKLNTMELEELVLLTKANSTKGLWREYNRYTSRSWLPIRLIKDREYRPDTTVYTLDNLVTAYLYNLYRKSLQESETTNVNQYSSNPLKDLEDNKHLSKYLKRIVNDSYMMIYNNKKENIAQRKFFNQFNSLNNDVGFKQFCQLNNFDIEDIKCSFEKIEALYKSAFFRIYMSPERINIFHDDLLKTVQNINEKLTYKNEANKTIDTNITLSEAHDLIEEYSGSTGADENKVKKITYYATQIKNNQLKQYFMIALSIANININYFDNFYSIIEKCISEDGNIDEIKALVYLQLEEKYQKMCDSNLSFDDFCKLELENYKLEDGEYDYNKFYIDKESELSLYEQLEQLEVNGDFEMYTLIMDMLSNKMLSNTEALSFIETYQTIPKKCRKTIESKLFQLNNENSPLNANNTKETFVDLMNKISQWNLGQPEIIVSKNIGKVVITSKAKLELWDKTNGNLLLFDQLINKFYVAATKMAARDNESGIKAIKNSPGIFELKIMGSGGNMRMYSKIITEEDIAMYKTSEDDTNVKFIFDSYDKHL